MKLRGGMLEGRGQIENEISSFRMKMKLQWKNKCSDTLFYLRRISSITSISNDCRLPVVSYDIGLY